MKDQMSSKVMITMPIGRKKQFDEGEQKQHKLPMRPYSERSTDIPQSISDPSILAQFHMLDISFFSLLYQPKNQLLKEGYESNQ